MSEVSLEDVRRVAELANLKLTETEEPAMQRDLNAILGHIAELETLDTAGVRPMAQVSDVLEQNAATANGELRVDTVKSSLARPAVMISAPETDGRFFKVPRVIER